MGIPASPIFLAARGEEQPSLLGVVPSDALHHHLPTLEQLVRFRTAGTDSAEAQQQGD